MWWHQFLIIVKKKYCWLLWLWWYSLQWGGCHRGIFSILVHHQRGLRSYSSFPPAHLLDTVFPVMGMAVLMAWHTGYYGMHYCAFDCCYIHRGILDCLTSARTSVYWICFVSASLFTCHYIPCNIHECCISILWHSMSVALECLGLLLYPSKKSDSTAKQKSIGSSKMLLNWH